MVKTEREYRDDMTAGRSLSDALLPEVIIGLGCVPLAAEDVAAGARECGAGEERFYVTRAELVALVDEAIGTRGA
jgi:hypothetical protein